MLNLLADATGIGTTVSDTINKYIDLVVNFLKNLPWYVEALILLVVAILLLIGIIRLIVKSWKVVLVLVILGGIGFAVYYFFLRGNSSTTTTVAETISFAIPYLRTIL